jgi:hypothetical protein
MPNLNRERKKANPAHLRKIQKDNVTAVLLDWRQQLRMPECGQTTLFLLMVATRSGEQNFLNIMKVGLPPR